MRNDRDNLIVDLTFQFATEILNFADILIENKKYELARQIIKSGTAMGSNAREAQNAESMTDFIHKMKIAAKEADETEFWLLLCKAAKSYPSNSKLENDIQPIIKILSKIISSSKK